MWLPRFLSLHAILVLPFLQQTCLASPPYHHGTAVRTEPPLNSPGSVIDANSLQRRVTSLQSVRVVQYLREIINITPAGEGPTNNDIWRICLEHVSNVLSINPLVNVQTISDVANKLARLYDLAMAALWEIIETHGYPSDDTDDTFSLTLGQVAIEWVCREGPLCWHLLYDFCIIMKEKARQGWTGIYSGELVNVGTGVVTWVRLTIKRGRGE